MQECNVELTKGEFVMATQNEDLAILKLLVEHARPKRNHGDDFELSQINQNDWIEWLFGPDNTFLQNIMTQESLLANYLKKVYKDETGQDFQIRDDTLSDNKHSSDELENAKALYVLQTQDGDLHRNIEVNTILNLTKNVELMVLNNKNHFSQNSTFVRRLFQNSVEHRNMALISLFMDTCPTLSEDVELFENCESSNILHAIKSCPEKFQHEAVRKYLIQTFQFVVQQKTIEDITFLISNYPDICVHKSLFGGCDSSNILLPIKSYPEKFQHEDVKKNVIQAFQFAVQQECHEDILELIAKFPAITKDQRLFENCESCKIFNALKQQPTQFQDPSQHEFVVRAFIESIKTSKPKDSSLLLDNFPNLSVDDSLFKADSSLPAVSAVLQTYPEIFGGKVMEQDLIQAFSDSNLELITSYIDNFSILSKNPFCKKLWDYALEKSNIHAIYQVLQKIPQLSNSNDELIKFLLTTDLRVSNLKPEDVNIKLDDQYHSPPLSLVAKKGSLELVKALLSKGANASTKDNDIETALHYAAWYGHDEVARLLIQNNAEVDAKGYNDLTPLHLAAWKGREMIAGALLKNHANPDARDYDQNTTLHIAAKNGCSNVVKVLIDYGACKRLTNDDDNTPFQVAKHSKLNDKKAVIALLEQ